MSYLLTTVDNPFDPYTQFDEWNAYDVSRGYNTLGFLARIARTSPEMSEPDQDFAIQQGIDEILEYNVLGIYRKAEPPT